MNAKRLFVLLAGAGVVSAGVVAFSRDTALQVVGASSPPTPQVPSTPEHHRVVIAGGGTGGITVAAQLKRKLGSSSDIVVVDAAKEHYYQPAWTLVGGGLYDAKDTINTLESVIPKGVLHKQANIAKFDPDSNQVQLTDGTTLSYDYLVVATGIETRWPVPGTGDGNSFVDGVCSIYAGPAQAARTYVMITGIKPGDSVIFTQPPTPIKCGGAPQKIAYLADDYLRRKGIRSQVDISFIIPQPKIFPASAHYNTALEVLAQGRNIKVETGLELAEAKLTEGKALFKKTGTQGPLEERKCNFLHIVPHMGPPPVVRCSKLSNPASGYCDVDKGTLQHVRYPNVFSLGDSAGLPTSKTAAAISSQAPVLVHNLMRVMQSKSTNAIYDGYTSCPIITGKHSLILAEFKYDGLPKESFGSIVDQRKEYAAFAYMKRFVFPVVYWNLFLTGRWYGPSGLIEPTFPEK